ncbi:MAG: hypothetical protein QOI21_5885 [Actinomycetota bacterium]|nr:hypothetical protein [Actinomycetota bacterium]
MAPAGRRTEFSRDGFSVGNPLVADVKSSTEAYSGVSLLETAHDLKSAIETGDWASVAMGSVGTALDALSMAMDPFGAALAAGVGWLIEHVGPLKEALDALAGDPDQIRANSETWANIATELGGVGQDLTAMVNNDTVSWTGVAADAYRQRAADTVALLGSAKEGSEGASSGVKTAGEVVAAVRSLVRDIIAELIGHMISWALQVVFTLGIGLAWVVPQVVAAVAKTAAHIADITGKLIKALKALIPLLTKAGDLFADAARALKNVKAGKGAPTRSLDDLPPGPKSPDAPVGGTGGGGKVPDTTKDPGGSPNKPEPPRDRSVPPDKRFCASDPVDVVTGEMVLEQTDLVLSSALELILRRTHVSSYRAGRWFGTSWASTVDQRLEVDAEDVCYFSPDGMVLVYPLPAPGKTALPVEGPRLPLTRHFDGGYTLEDPLRGQALRFEPVPGASPALLPLVAMSGAEAQVDIGYDPAGAPRTIRHSDGYRVEIVTAGRRITSITVLDNESGSGVTVMRYGYDTDGRLTQVINSSARPMLFDYDTQGRITGWQDRNGTWYRYVYDADGRCVRTVGDKGFRDGAFVYDRERRVTTYADSLGFRTEYHFNEANQVVRQVDPLGHATVSVWDRYDNLLSRTDPLGRTTGYEYDSLGTLKQLTRPDGSVVRVAIRGGAVAAIAVPGGDRVWTRAYEDESAPDPFGGKVGVAAAFRYQSLSSAGTTRPVGDVGEEAGGTGQHVRDMFGRPAVITTPAGARVRLGWTVEGLPASRVGPTGGREQWSYDPEGNDVSHVDEMGGVTRQEFGEFDVLVARTDPAGARTTYTYDTELRLTSVTNPAGLVWRYVHDPAGRLTEEQDFDGRTLRFSYDAAGQLTRTVNGLGELTEYVHDMLGNVVEKRTPSGATTYSYDPVGRLAGAANGDAVLEYERDAQGRVVAETVNGRTMTFTYDPDGQWIRRRTPSGVDSLWAFGETGVPLSLASGGHVLRFERDATGREVRRSLDDKVVLTQSFDAARRLTAQSFAGPDAGARQRRFDYRPDGHLIAAMDTVTGTVAFQLDPTGRVVELTAPDRRETYRYDAAGNITSATESGRWAAAAETGNRGYAGNTLTVAGAVNYQYDVQGRVVLRRQADRFGERIWRYTWDAQDRMTAVRTPDGSHWRYRYDPVGRRIAKQRLAPDQSVAESVEFVWDGGKLVEEIHVAADGSRRVRTWDYDPADDAPVAQLEAAGQSPRFHTIVTDQVGKPTDLVDADGIPGWHGRNTLWGRELRAEASVTTTPLRFPGQYLDEETGLHYNVYRYYDPATGRYVSQDPLGLAPAPNPVAYVGNPYAAADPLGLAPKSCSEGSDGDIGLSNRPGGEGDAALLNDTGSTPVNRPASPDTVDITDPAATSIYPNPGKAGEPDLSLNPPKPGYVFHGSDQPPNVIFQSGLTSDAIRGGKEPHYNMADHMHRSDGKGSGFVSTTGDLSVAQQFVRGNPEDTIVHNGQTFQKRDGWIYAINPSDDMVHLPSQQLPSGVDRFKYQDEWAAKDSIPPSQIAQGIKVEGYYDVKMGPDGKLKIVMPPGAGVSMKGQPGPGF